MREAARQLLDYLARAEAALGARCRPAACVMEPLLRRQQRHPAGDPYAVRQPHQPCLGPWPAPALLHAFNFELQARAAEDAIGSVAVHRPQPFDLLDVSRYLHSSSAEHVLVQAALDAPCSAQRDTTNAMALPRFTGGARSRPTNRNG